ncbi:MAG: TIGR02099 family protein [Methylotenera sp.]|nr:TIGR02099 family protein [Methylotenera sp.]
MVKKSLLWVYRVALWATGTVVAILLIAALSLHLWFMPNINQYKASIATFVSQTIKQKVVIGNIKADWRGVNPHLTLNDITIFDLQNRPALQLEQSDISLSWLSVPLLEPRLAELIIHAPALTIRRIASGEIFVAGFSMLGESKPDLPNWLLRQSKLVINDAKVIWLDEKRNAPALSLDKLNIEITSPPWRSIVKNHLFTVSAQPSTGSNYPIVMSGNLYGNDVSQIDTWRGNITVQLKDANLAAFKAWFDYPVDLQSGIGSADVTVKFASMQVQSITSEVSLTNLQLQLKPSVAPISLSKLAGKVNWNNLNKLNFSIAPTVNTARTSFGQSVSVNALTLIANNGLNLQNINADYAQTNQGHQTLNLKLPQLDLALIQPTLLQLPLPEVLLQKITGMASQGTLNNLTMHWEAQHDKTSAYQIGAKFNHLSIQAHDKIPGFTNLAGEIQANEKNGHLQLNTQNATLDIKDILRGPVPADKLSGEISWRIGDKVSEIKASKLSISSPHLSGVVDANYKMDGIKGGYLNLQGKFGNGNAKFASFYYPTMLGETTLRWLDTSILAGRAEDINLTVKGRLDDFPFVDSKNNSDPKQGVFRASAKISDALLEYGTGWPVIEKLGLNMLFEGKRMELNAHTGRILGNQIIKSKTTIAQLDADYPILNVESEIQGSVSEGINFVNKSPVHEITQGFTDNLKTSGKGKLNLGLKIPMQDIEASKYKGLYQITNGTMANDDIPALSNINGVLEFTESSLTAKNIKATAFSSPVAFNLTSGKDKSIRVAIRGKLNDEGLKQIFKEQNFAKASQYISGNADWAGDILIQKPRVSIGIRSDLNGITSHLPAPLNKSASQPFSLRVDKKQDANTDTLIVNIDNKIGAKIIRSASNGKMQLDSASVNINSNAVNFSEINNEARPPKGIQVTGNLDYLDADAWRGVLRDFTGGPKQSASLPIQKIALKVNALDIFDRRLNQLTITNKPNKEGLQANIQSREISGDLQWQSQNNGTLLARLSKLTIPDIAPHKISTNLESDALNANLKQFVKLDQDYPSLDIVADNFELDNKNLGTLELIAYPQNDNWNIQKFKLSTPEGSINGEGQWNNWVRSPNTYLNLTWDIKDLGKTLKRFGYPDTIKDGEGELTGTLHWPGSPRQFDTTRLNGELQFEVRKGQVLQAQPGVGRLLGLLSLQSLPRRLTLDFRDLFSNGFAFDKINATVKINQGVMRSDDFAMSGPAADVKIKGETNLKKETQHLFVKVMPRISDSISLAALAGGPLVGAVAFLAQKILKDPLNKIASSEYEIIGTWDKPQEVKSTGNNKNNEQSNDISPLN